MLCELTLARYVFFALAFVWRGISASLLCVLLRRLVSSRCDQVDTPTPHHEMLRASIVFVWVLTAFFGAMGMVDVQYWISDDTDLQFGTGMVRTSPRPALFRRKSRTVCRSA
jgi:hypothetical protein